MSYANLTLKPAKPDLSLIAFRNMGGGVYDITASGTRDMALDVAADIFREKMKGRAAIVGGSFRKVGDRVMRFAAKPTTTVKPYADSAYMTCLGNSQFADTASNIWAAIEADGERYLVLNSADDLDALYKEHCKRIAVTASFLPRTIVPEMGDVAGMVNDDGEIVYGVVSRVKDLYVLCDVASAKTHTLDANRVVNTVRGATTDTAALTAADAKELFRVLAKVYTKDYLKAYRAAIGL